MELQNWETQLQGLEAKEMMQRLIKELVALVGFFFCCCCFPSKPLFLIHYTVMEKMVGGGMTRNRIDSNKGLPLDSVISMRICHNSWQSATIVYVTIYHRIDLPFVYVLSRLNFFRSRLILWTYLRRNWKVPFGHTVEEASNFPCASLSCKKKPWLTPVGFYTIPSIVRITMTHYWNLDRLSVYCNEMG